MAISAEDQIIHYLKDKVGLAKADELVAGLRGEIAASLREFADQEDAHLAHTSASAYVRGIRDAADRVTDK
ncbi:hypothetical protein [Streptomyces pacificus]|uniref:Uncharacterized protein n=1 Tax=Streptomyces pacificus TaxID=2705029 RepID=A0A6A0ANR8_9ACTN|nr:hypothetical protein [Streptomyces pacificus]GFH34268.1 hypothetical protein SCWH03_04820 [Streptomyces pacificus]